MFTVYVIYSKSYNKIYIGFSGNLPERIEMHNSPLSTGYTKRYQPWEVVYQEEYITKKEAMLREKQLKSGGGRRFIWDYIKKLS
jgi:putative endonuclease